MNKQIINTPSTQKLPFEKVKGTIRFPLTNDFMFHIVLEHNPGALKKLISSLLHMNPEEIISVEIKNPIDYGTKITDKKIILDIKLLLNGYRIINIEMQVLDQGNWPERSVIYLCRCFDNVSRGKDYETVLPAHQISIIDFEAKDFEPEFYSTHHIRNDRTGALFSGNFVLSVLNLRHIDLATDEDKKWQIDQWARLFKATTWEELRMIAARDVEMNNVAETLYDKHQDEYAMYWAMSREMALFDERCLKANVREAEEKLKKEQSENKRLRQLLLSNGIDPDKA